MLLNHPTRSLREMYDSKAPDYLDTDEEDERRDEMQILDEWCVRTVKKGEDMGDIRQEFKIKEGCTASTSDFWYDLTSGGYLKPEDILERPEDVEKVKGAIAVLRDFEESCRDQIEDFDQ